MKFNLNGKEIDETTLTIENVWESEFDEDGVELEEEEMDANVIATSAEYIDGIELTDDELEKFNEQEHELILKIYQKRKT